MALCLSLASPRETGHSGCTSQETDEATLGTCFLTCESSDFTNHCPPQHRVEERGHRLDGLRGCAGKPGQAPGCDKSDPPLAQRGFAHLDHADDLFDGSPEIVHPGCNQKCWKGIQWGIQKQDAPAKPRTDPVGGGLMTPQCDQLERQRQRVLWEPRGDTALLTFLRAVLHGLHDCQNT